MNGSKKTGDLNWNVVGTLPSSERLTWSGNRYVSVYGRIVVVGVPNCVVRISNLTGSSSSFAWK